MHPLHLQQGHHMSAQFGSYTSKPGAFRWGPAAAAAAATAAAALITFTSPSAVAATLLIDGFDDPAAPVTHTLSGVSSYSFNQVTASVPGGVRGVNHNMYTNPSAATTTLSSGGGSLNSATGAGAQAEVVVAYGAFTRPIGDPAVSGASFGLNTTPYNAFRFDFISASTVLNINVEMYTSNPLNPGAPLYYSSVGINAAPAVPGGPMTVILPFLGTDPFNYAQVDGIVFYINRANDSTGVSFVLDNFSMTTAVPEPAPLALWAAGLGALVWLRKRRASATAV
jgi:hypothetical protein